jgi:hypothetical protein
MTPGRNHGNSGVLLSPSELAGIPTEQLLMLLTTHTGRLTAKRGEVLEYRVSQRLILACDQIAWELRRRSAQASLF